MQFELASNPAPHLVFDPSPLNAIEQRADDSALTSAKNFHQATSELVASIEEIDRLRVFEKFGLRSTFAYCCQRLRLSEDVAANLIVVARQTRMSPVLKEAIASKELGVTKARRICAVLTPENETEWVEKAKELSKAELEKEVACVAPKAVSRSMAKPVGPNRNKIQFEASDEFLRKYRRAQDLESQRCSKAVDMEETLLAALDAYLNAHDPVRKAARAQMRSEKRMARAIRSTKASGASTEKPGSHATGDGRAERNPSRAEGDPAERNPSRAEEDPAERNPSKVGDGHLSSNPSRAGEKARTPVPAEISHQAMLRDRGECRAILPDGTLCGATRWTDLHHIRPLSEGGGHDVENLITLCKAHHRQWHKWHQKERDKL